MCKVFTDRQGCDPGSEPPRFNPYPVDFWDHHRACFLEKKSKNIACDVTVRTNKIKIICADSVSFGLSYGGKIKWHMPLCEEICRAEQKYMPFFETITERVFPRFFSG